MRFSLYLMPQTPGADQDLEVIDASTREAVQADADGFAAIFLTEHHFNGINTYGDPFMFGAYLAPQLRQAYIALAVAVAPLHHPLRLAESINLLDALTRGRVLIGIGSGGTEPEFAGFGQDLSQKQRLTDEVTEVVERALRLRADDAPLTFDLPSGRGRLSGRVMPSSFRDRLLRGRACLSDAGFQQAGAAGWAAFTGRFPAEEIERKMALYRSALRSASHAPDLINMCLQWSGIQKNIYIAETDAEAWRMGRELCENYLGLAARAAPGRTIAGFETTRISPETFAEQATFIGSPETIARRIREYADRGVEHLILSFRWGFNTHERIRASYRLFVDEVMPRFSERPHAVAAASGGHS